ncbi:hypothetical protein chiPu_0002907 [Chiloscyllium punctatum]|uniref:Protein kinase domain-containing protein n=1 Tax=Chiloscyllium punctatum TaxID=137246 RepID=A0A401S2B2_CHIPU|nr:hypothetical protein [Chiloscyllium punctatum]
MKKNCRVVLYFTFDFWLCFERLWNPEHRLTPDEAMKHRWIQQSRMQKSRLRMKVMPMTGSNNKQANKKAQLSKTGKISCEMDVRHNLHLEEQTSKASRVFCRRRYNKTCK